MSPEKEKTGSAIEDVLKALRRQFPDATEDEVFERLIAMTREDKQLQSALLRDERLIAKVVTATRRLAKD